MSTAYPTFEDAYENEWHRRDDEEKREEAEDWLYSLTVECIIERNKNDERKYKNE